MPPVNEILNTDCVSAMRQLPEGYVDLAFADPPFNIGYDYDVYHDRKERDVYLDWSREWIGAVHRALKPTGTFWLAIGDEYAAELKIISQDTGFHYRSWVVWYYTFGVNCKRKFTRSHAHLFHFVKDPDHFTFNAEQIRVPSARQLVYNDNRANPVGRLPDDTWILRPQDLPEGFQAEEDTWYFPRVAGTFKERAGFHGCQMPEQLLGRIIRCCSNAADGKRPADLVLDPFSGSASTLIVAKKLGRRFLGCDLSPEYVAQGTVRLETTNVGDALVGAPEPLVSAPATHRARRNPPFVTKTTPLILPSDPPQRVTAAERDAIVSAFQRVHGGYSADYLLANHDLNAQFVDACRKYGAVLPAVDLNRTLLRLRKSSRLPSMTTKRVQISDSRFDEFEFASEIAVRLLQDRGYTLDGILCDPAVAEEFDLIASRFAPGFSSFEFRWGALRIRKMYHVRIAEQDALDLVHRRRRGEKPVRVLKLTSAALPEAAGTYRVFVPEIQQTFVGATLNLRRRLLRQFEPDRLNHVWGAHSAEMRVTKYVEHESGNDVGFRQVLVERYNPIRNYRTQNA
jgi:DNA modification methylase